MIPFLGRWLDAMGSRLEDGMAGNALASDHPSHLEGNRASHQGITALCGRSVGNGCAGHGQREQLTPSDHEEALGVVHPRARVINTLGAPAPIVHGASGPRLSTAPICVFCGHLENCTGACDNGGFIY